MPKAKKTAARFLASIRHALLHRFELETLVNRIERRQPVSQTPRSNWLASQRKVAPSRCSGKVSFSEPSAPIIARLMTYQASSAERRQVTGHASVLDADDPLQIFCCGVSCIRPPGRWCAWARTGRQNQRAHCDSKPGRFDCRLSPRHSGLLPSFSRSACKFDCRLMRVARSPLSDRVRFRSGSVDSRQADPTARPTRTSVRADFPRRYDSGSLAIR
jgi:hypothetical protein